MNYATATLAWFRAWGRAGLFGFAALAAALSPSAYTRRTRALAMRQLYFGAWQVLPGFTALAALLSLVVIQVTITLGAPQILNYRIEGNPNAPAEAKALRASWLNGR